MIKRRKASIIDTQKARKALTENETTVINYLNKHGIDGELTVQTCTRTKFTIFMLANAPKSFYTETNSTERRIHLQPLSQEDIDCVISLYHQTKSRKQVARKLGLSEYRVRRLLVDNGILSDYDAAIAAAIDAGDNLEDAARKFGVAPNTIRSHLPYTKGCYCTAPDSKNAKRIRKCRAKKKASAEADAFPLNQ